jgi:hypothetical protein|tara:strand:- start:138 stop:464 length:327 start_codon:yes stop_codon:yes gene_type:complete
MTVPVEEIVGASAGMGTFVAAIMAGLHRSNKWPWSATREHHRHADLDEAIARVEKCQESTTKELKAVRASQAQSHESTHADIGEVHVRMTEVATSLADLSGYIRGKLE